MPTLTVSGLPSSLEGLNDGYVQTGMNNGQPVWIGTRNRAVAYLCGGSWAGRWAFNAIDGGQDYQSDMSGCRGQFVFWPSKRQLYTGGSWIDVDVTVTCTSCQAEKTRTRSLLVLF